MMLQEMILHTCGPGNGFFSLRWTKSIILQEMIFHIFGLTSGFFFHIGEEKTNILINDNSHLHVR
jgi:hypothetical protein